MRDKATARCIAGIILWLLMSPLTTVTTQTAAASTNQAEWTIMVYLNSKNNLETDGILNFYQMATVGSSDKVNILVEMGRPTRHYTDSDGPWSGVLRFRVTRNMQPIPGQAIMDVGKAGLTTDMGSAEALKDFVLWGMLKYPARHYMLIIWNHGQGWRFQLTSDRSTRERAATRGVGGGVSAQAIPTMPAPNGYRSVSYDEDTGKILYNRDIQDTLQSELKGAKFEVLGFDACLMSMIETAYATRNVARFMVGSQELEPGEGWPYDKWLPYLNSNPSLGGAQLAARIVDSYKSRYGDSGKTTLSALDLSKVGEISSALTTFAEGAIGVMQREAPVIRQARLQCKNYGEDNQMHNPIDLACFLDTYVKTTPNIDLRSRAARTRDLIASVVLHNYASKRLQNGYGSAGISIYFPISKQAFEQDHPDNQGYRLDNTFYPVEFVQKEKWGSLLQEYFKYRLQ